MYEPCSSPTRRGSSRCPRGPKAGRIWGRTGCYFPGDHCRCSTGDCTGARSCALSGKPPATLAEFTIGVDAGVQDDFYDVSVVDGFNVAMDFKCITGGGDPIQCRNPPAPTPATPATRRSARAGATATTRSPSAHE